MSVQGFWKLNDNAGNGVWLDYSGNNYHLTGVNTPAAGDGHGGATNAAALFTRTSVERLHIIDASAPNLSFTGSFSISAWVYLTTLPAAGQYFSIVAKLGNSGNYSYDFLINPNGKLFLRVSSNGTTLTTITGTTSLAATTYYHVVAVCDVAGTLKLYINNASDATPVTAPTGVYNGTSEFEIGGDNNNHFMDGRIDDVAVYNHALTTTAIADLYAAGDNTLPGSLVSGIIKDKLGNVIDCSIYNVTVVAYVAGNVVSSPVSRLLVTTSDGSWSLTLSTYTTYIITYELQGNYYPTGDIDIAGAEIVST